MADVLPVGWESKRLDDFGNFKNGLNKSKEDFGFGTKFVNIGDAYSNTLNTLKLSRVNINEKETEQYRLKYGDIIFVRSSVKPSGVGYPTLFIEDKEPIVYSGFMIRFRTKSTAINWKFLLFSFRSELFRNELLKVSTISANTNINQVELGKLKVTLPPLPEQKKIASILSSIDEVIEKTTAQVAKLKDLKTSLMQELLTRGIGHSEFKDSPVGRIPVEWEVLPLGDIVIDKGLQTGPFGSQLHAHEYVEYGIPVVMPKDMKNQSINTDTIARITDKKAKKLDKHKVEEGDILFSRRGDIGRCVLVHKENIGWLCGTGCLRVRLGKKINPTFFASYLTLTNVIEWLNNNAVGQTMLNLNTSILSELPVILPPIKEQITIANTFFSIDKKITTTNQKLSALNHTKKALMQDLLTGKKRVIV
jgi:type I restriction enzyme S subunit